MANKSKTLKNYNGYLNTFTIVNSALFIWFTWFCKSKSISLESINQVYKIVNEKNGIILFSLLLLTIILNSLLSSNQKYSLVYWRIKNPLPGTRIFTEIAHKDPRINMNMLSEKYGELPINPNEQNNLWYEIYSKHKDDTMVFESHRSFLMMRDMTGLSIIFFVVYSISSLVIKGSIKFTWIYILCLFVQYIAICVSCRNLGERFACNVLAVDLTEKINEV